MKYFYTNAYQKGNKIHLRGYANGKRFHDAVDYQPYLFLPGKGEYKTVYGERLVKHDFKNLKAAREFTDMYSQASNVQYYGMTNWTFAFLNDEFPNDVEYDSSLISIVSLDIEVSAKNGMPDIEAADEAVTTITLVRNGKSLSFGYKAYNGKHKKSYVLCEDEKHMLEAFLHTINNDQYWMPDVITGWSVDFFDVPYLIHRVQKLMGEEAIKQFSPLRVVKMRNMVRAKSNAYASKKLEDRSDVVYEIGGISVVDYIQVYKKFAPTQESYALNHIAKVELGRGKHDYSDIGSLDDLYEIDFDRYVDYNVEDAVLVEEIEKKKKYLQIIFSIAYTAKINYNDAMTTSRPWDAIIHGYLMKKKIAIPQPKEPPAMIDFPGGYVKQPQIGLHHWVVSFDFDALYPSILSQQNISPETFESKIDSWGIEWCLNHMDSRSQGSSAVTANGCLFRKDKRGFIPEIVDTFIEKRVNIKNRMMELKKQDPDSPEIEALDHFQLAVKILNNGLYGSLGQKHFRWFDINLAEAVTTTAQVCTRYVEQQLNIYLNKVLKTQDKDYVIACDTDSVYLSLGTLVKEIGLEGKSTGDVIESVDKICRSKFQPLIERCCVELCQSFDAYKPRLKMKREAIADKGVWRGAKMYILNIWDLEGVRYDEPQLKYKGIEVVRSSTPMVCRDNIKKCLKIIMNEDETSLQKFVKQFRTEFMKLPFEEVAFPRSVNKLDDYYDSVTVCRKGTPIHVRGALNYNNWLDKTNTKKYSKIRNRDKIRFSYLIQPNPVQSHVIAAPDELPKELGLDNYIDRATQWDRAFESPIKSITDVIGWKIKKVVTLEGLI